MVRYTCGPLPFRRVTSAVCDAYHFDAAQSFRTSPPCTTVHLTPPQPTLCPDRVEQLEERKKKSLQKRERKATGEEQERKRSKMQRVFVAGKGSTVLTETEELDSINYRPKTKQSR